MAGSRLSYHVLAALVVLGFTTPAMALMRGDIARDKNGLRRSTLMIETPEGLCTGTLIGPRLVVTAAHCVVRSGKYRLMFADTRFRMRPVGVRRVQLHSGFDPANLFSPDDIGLIELDAPLPPHMAPASLPTWSGRVSEGEDLVIAGFGSTDVAGARDGILRESVMAAAPSSVPGRSFAGLAGAEEGRMGGMCVGDSGGPVYRRRNSEWVLVGILKGGTVEGARECTPRPVYTPMHHYAGWIRDAAIGWGLTLGAVPGHRPDMTR